MKKGVFLIIMLCGLTSIWASGIYRLPIIVHQADGSTLTLIGHGDENFHWVTTTDGVILVRSGENFYVADIDDNGNLHPTAILAHNKGERRLLEEMVISMQDQTKFLKIAEQNIHQAVRKASINNEGKYYTPHTGNVRGIAILVEFSDTTFSLPNPKKSFEYYLNGEHIGDNSLVNGETDNVGSVNQYFKDISFGQFSPSFDVYGPVNVNQKTSFYSSGSYGRTSLIIDACIAADELINFSDPIYDSDGDGYVDVVSIIYAGYGSNYSSNPDWWIWPASNGNFIGEFDGAKVFRWLVCEELFGNWGIYKSEPYCHIEGIGVFCHEFSHCLGLPDFYPTNISARINNQEMEFWDLMDGGEYLNNGHCPPPYTAWERETMGWMTIDTLLTNQHHIEICPIDYGGKAYRFINPNDEDKLECFMIENIQNKKWNTQQKGHGLLVYHVDYSSNLVDAFDHPNNTKGKPRMAVVPADGLLLSSYILNNYNYINPETDSYFTDQDYITHHAGDPFPGSKDITSLTYDMKLPNYEWHIGDKEVKHSLLNISEDTESGIITFDFISDYTKGDTVPIDVETNYIADGIDITNSINTQNQSIFTIDGRKVNAGEQIYKGFYIQGKRKFVIR